MAEKKAEKIASRKHKHAETASHRNKRENRPPNHKHETRARRHSANLRKKERQ
jgi:hypothetical protein